MEKEFIPYEQALALKELGFDNENCFGWWTYRYDSTEGYLDTLKIYCFQIKDDLNRQCLAPLYQQAFRWFREKYDIEVKPMIIVQGNDKYYNLSIIKPLSTSYTITNEYKRLNTYEEAELECLKKLIEIVKNK
jgi:hypothetical protein